MPLINSLSPLGSVPYIKMSLPEPTKHLGFYLGLYKRTNSTTSCSGDSDHPVYQLESQEQQLFLFVDNAGHWCVYKEVNTSVTKCYLSSHFRPSPFSPPPTCHWSYWYVPNVFFVPSSYRALLVIPDRSLQNILFCPIFV